MKGGPLQLRSGQRQCGFTLLEMSTAMGILMILSTALVAMMQQHVLFLEMCQRQSFFTSEAPKVGNILGRILNNADHYFVYADKDDALGTGSPVLTEGGAVKLFFKSADQTVQTRVIAVEPTGTGAALKFYTPQPAGGARAWTITSKIAATTFQSAEGILNITLQGPNGEQVTYSGGAK